MADSLKLAVIGMGHRASSLMTRFQQLVEGFQLVAVADVDLDGARERTKRAGVDGSSVSFFSSEDELLEHSREFDGILIASHCNVHTPVAVKVASTRLPVFLEKPVSVSYEQTAQLRNAYRGREKSVVASFPLRRTPLFESVMEVVRSGDLGAINQVQAVNNVPYGWVYYSRPSYRDYSKTHGLWLQKATHDFDYLNQVLGCPTAVTAMMSRSVYGGDMPHELWCSSCELVDTCLESPSGMKRSGNTQGVLEGDHPCVFGEEIVHQDAGSAIVQYAQGVHAAYSQNFVSRKGAATRGAVITGYKATLSFDWYRSALTVTDHHSDRVDQVEIERSGDHMGGDEALIKNFADVCLGRDESRTDLTAGLVSVTMCLAARESAHRMAWMPVRDVESADFPHDSSVLTPTQSDLEPVPGLSLVG